LLHPPLSVLSQSLRVHVNLTAFRCAGSALHKPHL
jgi:hypothetical protein